jgi:hypothetical protein
MELPKTESQLRFEVRMAWREEGRIDKFKDYPLYSYERSICISEGQKIVFAEELSRDPY